MLPQWFCNLSSCFSGFSFYGLASNAGSHSHVISLLGLAFNEGVLLDTGSLMDLQQSLSHSAHPAIPSPFQVHSISVTSPTPSICLCFPLFHLSSLPPCFTDFHLHVTMILSSFAYSDSKNPFHINPKCGVRSALPYKVGILLSLVGVIHSTYPWPQDFSLGHVIWATGCKDMIDLKQ